MTYANKMSNKIEKKYPTKNLLKKNKLFLAYMQKKLYFCSRI